MKPRWRHIRAPVILALAVAALAMGTIGYMLDSPQASGDDLGFSDALYKAFQLFAFGGGDVPEDAPLILDLARFLAPLLVGYAAIRGLVALSREQLQLAGLRLWPEGHVVIAGLGELGFRLADSLNELGARVIAVEKDAASPMLPSCRERGIPTLIGDATDPDVLRRARCGHARFLISACSADGVNIDVAAAGRAVSEERTRGVLVALARIDDRRLRRALEARILVEPPHAAFRLELFNVVETAIRLLLSDHDPFPDAGEQNGSPPQIVIVGDEPVTESLVTNIARLWKERRAHPAARARILLVGAAAQEALDRMVARYPKLTEICELEPGPGELTATDIRTDSRIDHASAIYIALQDEAAGVAAALALGDAPGRWGRVVLVVTDVRYGAASLIGSADSPAPRMHVFGLLDRSLIPALLFGGLNESLARAMHDSYYRAETARGVTAAENEAVVPWDKLPESLRESNRRFADGIGPALRRVNCIAIPAPLVDSDSGVAFSPDEVETLARFEHERWVRDHVRDGWILGDHQDPHRRIHNFLIPWEELPDEEREKDRVAVRNLPRMLALAGYELYRVDSEGGASDGSA